YYIDPNTGERTYHPTSTGSSADRYETRTVTEPTGLMLVGSTRRVETRRASPAGPPTLGNEGGGAATRGPAPGPPAVYHSEGCPHGDYHFSTQVQAQRVTFTAVPAFAALPVTYRWSIAGFNAPIAVSGSGTATLAAYCEFPDVIPPIPRETRADVMVQ